MAIERLRKHLLGALGTDALLSDAADTAPYCTDWLNKWHGKAAMVVRPQNTQQVAYVHKMCAELRIPIVPQGGNTGMSGGATPNDSGDQVVISMTRMQRIRSIDPLNQTMTVDAGLLLAHAREAACNVGMQLPMALGSEGSCTIGGNIATNAGGIHALRWGTMRNLVLGLEVVLPDGRIWNGLRGLRKDNTGYDLKHLFIGSEGTLGTITCAVLQLQPADKTRACAWLHASQLSDLTEALSLLRSQCGANLCAFEMLEHQAIQLIQSQLSDMRCPIPSDHGFHTLVELASPDTLDLQTRLEDALVQWLEKDDKRQAVMAHNASQIQQMWKLREGISLAQKQFGFAIKHDIALPVSALESFCSSATAYVKNLPAAYEAQLINFGHLGDGNLHFNVLLPHHACPEDKATLVRQINRYVHDLVHHLGGSISAEHGIGQLRREDNRRYKNPEEMDLMLHIKRALDPNLIMNPGKLL